MHTDILKINTMARISVCIFFFSHKLLLLVKDKGEIASISEALKDMGNSLKS
jgi:hypothetical protein